MSNLRILLVDDDSDVRLSIHDFLKHQYPDCAITEECDGENLVASAEKARDAGEPFNLYFTDYDMPNLTGLEAVTTLRNKNDMTPVVFYTGDANEIIPHLTQLTHAYCAPKTCGVKRLKEIVETALASSSVMARH